MLTNYPIVLDSVRWDSSHTGLLINCPSCVHLCFRWNTDKDEENEYAIGYRFDEDEDEENENKVVDRDEGDDDGCSEFDKVYEYYDGDK